MNESINAITPNQYMNLIERYEKLKIPFYVSGPPGIGKSEMPRQVLRRVAKQRNLQFIEWADASQEQRMLCIDNPQQFYVLMDARTANMDTTSMNGVPNMANTRILENIPYSWVVYMTQPEANGTVFFDEINLAPPIVQATAYSVINEQVISDRRMGRGVYVMAAGNRSQDRGHTFEMSLPLRDRFAEAELKFDPDAWLSWAYKKKNNINSHICAFVNWQKSKLYQFDPDVLDKPTTPRGVVRASKAIEGLDIEEDADLIHLLVTSCAGGAFATEFIAYTNCYAQLDWNCLLDPKRRDDNAVKKMSPDKHWAIMGGIVERFREDPDNQKQFDQLVDLMYVLKQTYVVNCIRMMRQAAGPKLGQAMRNTPKGREIAEKYSKLVMRS